MDMKEFDAAVKLFGEDRAALYKRMSEDIRLYLWKPGFGDRALEFLKAFGKPKKTIW